MSEAVTPNQTLDAPATPQASDDAISCRGDRKVLRAAEPESHSGDFGDRFEYCSRRDSCLAGTVRIGQVNNVEDVDRALDAVSRAGPQCAVASATAATE